ncbi:MAG: bifunctional demethylmenaquinone methyltransferase/2-methoxy-6-polyprenyl-1,4-benzoquinol methylase UbiE [Gammaproteobacteria bacterium]|nr:MAG: bifunctional demethylmenaquinone methyltransferase/2-methoxy-6-polyprenyl-1,4-benzoquinol methylase UbiE [Gammaproteobacteria bacterium]
MRPHPVLKEYYSDESAREARIKRLFNDTARHYDWINKVMSFGRGEIYRKEALQRAGLESGQSVLDIGCGTGVLARNEIDIVGPSGFVIGIDPSVGMLKQAVNRGVNHVALGRGESLPLCSESVDFISMGYALRHVADLKNTFTEYFRVLKPGGTLLLLEMVLPKSRLMYVLFKIYLRYLIPLIVRLRSGDKETQLMMSYFWDTMAECVPHQSIIDGLERSGFTQVKRNVIHGIFGEFIAIKDA